MNTTTRLISLADAEPLVELLLANRAFLTPWEPARPDDFFTLAGQRRIVEVALRDAANGAYLPHVVLDGRRIVGRITLSNIVRGVFQSCNVGYWIGEADNGRGHASAAVARIERVAFRDLRLHRIEAGTLLTNVGSQRVLERNGFHRFGLAPRYLRIAGEWRDHLLYQRLNDAA